MDGPNVKLGPFFKFMAYYKLSEILTLIGGGTPKTTNPSYWGGNIPWLSVVDFNNDNRYVHTTEKTITEEGVENSSTKILPQSSLILSARGTVGALAQLAKPMAFNQSCYGIIAKEQTTNDFLYYLLKNVVEDLQAKGHGSVFNTITRDTFDTITVDLPPLDEQKRIAEILGSLDDKIELLQKQNKTLEEMAEATFKSWFVDFDVVRAKQKGLPKADIMREYHLTDELYDLFPSSFADSPLGPIPSGWEVKPLGAICQLALGGTPSRTNLKYWEKGSIPWINSGKVNDFRIITPSEYITEAGYNSSATKLLPIHTTVVAITGATLGQVSFTEIECCANQSVVGILENEKLASEYIYLFILFNLDKLLAKQTGGAQQHINKNDIASLMCLVPSEKILERYKQKQKPLFDKIHNNMVQIQTLTELRDTLLPRLISGKIEV